MTSLRISTFGTLGSRFSTFVGLTSVRPILDSNLGTCDPGTCDFSLDRRTGAEVAFSVSLSSSSALDDSATTAVESADEVTVGF